MYDSSVGRFAGLFAPLVSGVDEVDGDCMIVCTQRGLRLAKAKVRLRKDERVPHSSPPLYRGLLVSSKP